jgi:hypothetical protein
LAASDLELREPISVHPWNLAMSVKTMRMSFRDGDGFIGVGYFYRSVSCCFHQIDRVHPTKKFILNDKNVWL